MPLWLTDYQDAGGCATQRQFAENILPILRVDNVYVLSNGLVLCGVCHRALRGVTSVHCHFAAKGHGLEYHDDGDTFLTAALMLSHPSEFAGGDFELRRGNCIERHAATRGELMVRR